LRWKIVDSLDEIKQTGPTFRRETKQRMHTQTDPEEREETNDATEIEENERS